ncbi:MAG: hypothetical protein Q7J35_14220 [Candidatus Methanoperedens sp.]|nr:hypothetical protein [Candidatus Methanoperedens sp.]
MKEKQIAEYEKMKKIISENPKAGATILRTVHKISPCVISAFYMTGRREIERDNETHKTITAHRD